MKDTLALLRSVRFNIGLISLLAGLFALGTVIPQETDAPEEVRKFQAAHAVLGPLFDRLGLSHLYKTPLVIGLLALLAFDIFVCRVWPQLKELRQAWKIRRETGALKFSRAKWGSLTNHIGLVIVLAGALIKLLWGFEEFVMIIPGQDKSLERFPLSTISLFEFKVDFYPETRVPRLFESDLQVALDSQVKRHALRVNSPLTFNNVLPIAPVRFYQASWGATGMYRNAELDLGKTRMNIKLNEEKPIPGTPFVVKGGAMLPDFTLAEGRPDTKSLEWNQPALSLIFKDRDSKTRPIWLLLNSPNVAFQELPDGTLEHIPPPPFRLAGIDPVFFSGISVAYDPGFPFIIAGIFLILTGFGLYLSAKLPKVETP